MPQIQTLTIAHSLADLDQTWKILARGSPWLYEIPQSEVHALHQGVNEGRISIVTGHPDGQAVLYGRLAPIAGIPLRQRRITVSAWPMGGGGAA
jgi:hypothetical protein